jgi:exodeoxyribonuclease-3
MRIASWNINGIRARHEALKAWVADWQPDIVILQEIKASEEDIPLSITGLEGYSKFWNASSFRKGYSGLGILVRDTPCRPASSVLWEIPGFDLENRTGVIHCSSFSLIGTYVPRGDGEAHYAVKLRYLADMRNYIVSLLEKGREVILAGDMNVALRDIDVHRSQNKPGAIGLRSEERNAIEAQLSLGLIDIMRELNPEKKDLFTWWPNWKVARERNLGWRIDCFYLSGGLRGHVAGAKVDLDEKSSDHAPVVLDLFTEMDFSPLNKSGPCVL